MNGTMNAASPMRIARNPVRSGGALAMAAPAYAANATGGVIAEIMPEYKTKRCADILGTPALTREGAISTARIM